jgi:hypothetical protein
MRISKLVCNTALVLCALLVIAAPAAAHARYFKDKDQKSFRVEIRASSKRVLSGLFVAVNKHALKCDDGILVGGWTIKSARIVNGRFRAVASDTAGEAASWDLMIRGRMRGDTIRGAIKFHYVYRDANGVSECWSGKWKEDPLISYVARAGA